MISVIEDLIDFISDTWEALQDKDKKISLKVFSTIACILTDLYYAALDILNTWKTKDEKIITKILCTISTIIFLILGIAIWL